jgi:hypothetical protein
MKIREEVSRLLKYRIGKGQWDEVFMALNREGRLDSKTTKDLLLLICKYLEEREPK